MRVELEYLGHRNVFRESKEASALTRESKGPSCPSRPAARPHRRSCRKTSHASRHAAIHSYLQRELDRSSQENGYLLNQIVRRYETGEPSDTDVVKQRAAEIAALTGDAVKQAAVTYLDPARYVRVTLMPEK